MSAVVKHVDDNIICLLATQHMHAPVHAGRGAKLSTLFLLSYGPNRPQMNLIDYKI